MEERDNEKKFAMAAKMENFPCFFESCGQVFGERKFRNKHFMDTHVTSPTKCPYENCNKKIGQYKATDTSNMVNHIWTYHDKVLCEICNRSVLRKTLSTHQKLCSQPIWPIKKKEPIQEENLEHPIVQSECRKCGEHVLQVMYAQHLRICGVGEGGVYKCDFKNCYKCFKTRFHVENHKRLVHAPKAKKSRVRSQANMDEKTLRRICPKCKKVVPWSDHMLHTEHCRVNFKENPVKVLPPHSVFIKEEVTETEEDCNTNS